MFCRQTKMRQAKQIAQLAEIGRTVGREHGHAVTAFADKHDGFGNLVFRHVLRASQLPGCESRTMNGMAVAGVVLLQELLEPGKDWHNSSCDRNCVCTAV